jgi:hypothetical protein
MEAKHHNSSEVKEKTSTTKVGVILKAFRMGVKMLS